MSLNIICLGASGSVNSEVALVVHKIFFKEITQIALNVGKDEPSVGKLPGSV